MLPAEKGNVQTAAVGLAGRDAVVYLSASVTVDSYDMTVRDRSLILTTTSDNGLEIKLPPVAEAAGMIFLIYLETYSTNAVTVDDAGDDPDQSQFTMDLANDSVVCISDGIHWFCMDGTVPDTVD